MQNDPRNRLNTWAIMKYIGVFFFSKLHNRMLTKMKICVRSGGANEKPYTSKELEMKRRR